MRKILLILLVLSSASAFAGLHKWVDAKGKVHYSDQPPPANVESTLLRATSSAEDSAAERGATASSAPAAPKTIAEREAELKKAQQTKQESADKAARKQEEADARKASCAAARQSLRTMQDGSRIVEVDASGERSFLGDERRQQRMDKARQDISNYCD